MQTIYFETVLLIKAVEAHLVEGRMTTVSLPIGLKRYLLFPGKFLYLGIKEKLVGVFIFNGLVLLFALFGLFAMNLADTNDEEFKTWFYSIALLISMTAVMFPLPSMYSDTTISQRAIEFVCRHLSARGFTDAQEIALLQKAINLFTAQAVSRANALKWLARLMWIFLIYVFTRYLDFAKSQGIPGLISGNLNAQINSLVWLGVGAYSAYLCAWGYEASVHRLFRTIEFGCYNYSHTLQKKQSQDVTS